MLLNSAIPRLQAHTFFEIVSLYFDLSDEIAAIADLPQLTSSKWVKADGFLEGDVFSSGFSYVVFGPWHLPLPRHPALSRLVRYQPLSTLSVFYHNACINSGCALCGEDLPFLQPFSFFEAKGKKVMLDDRTSRRWFFRSAKERIMIKRCLATAIAIFVVSMPTVSGQSVNLEPFRGIGPIGVLIEGLRDEGRRANISDEELQAFVELKLRQSGIPLRNINDSTIESPYIYINVNLMYLEQIDHFTYSIEVSLNQAVRLLRNDNTVTAKTWSRESVNIIKRDRVSADVRNTIDRLLTLFLNSYLSANPKDKR